MNITIYDYVCMIMNLRLLAHDLCAPGLPYVYISLDKVAFFKIFGLLLEMNGICRKTRNEEVLWSPRGSNPSNQRW